MSFGWQDIIVAAICVAAAAYVARAVWLSIAGRKSSGCGTTCGKCSATQPKPVLQIETPERPSAD
jgi:FeoB-associated Cys-rich membrane protein